MHFFVKYYIGMEAKVAKSKLVVRPADGIVKDGAWPEPLPAKKPTLNIVDSDGTLRLVWRPDYKKLDSPA